MRIWSLGWIAAFALLACPVVAADRVEDASTEQLHQPQGILTSYDAPTWRSKRDMVRPLPPPPPLAEETDPPAPKTDSSRKLPGVFITKAAVAAATAPANPFVDEKAAPATLPGIGGAAVGATGTCGGVCTGLSQAPCATCSGCVPRTLVCQECCGEACEEEAWSMPQPRILQAMGITMGGWTEGGVSVVANQPADRYNGVVTFNDRDGEPMLNQQWFFVERLTNTEDCCWDIGGRVDFLYGTDARFTKAADGLEEDWDQTERFYQAALPQFYMDVAYGDWLVRAGHFFTILGYEVVPATGNFFYSHSYTMQYGEPFTHTGVLVSRTLGERWKLTGGLHRGNDQFDDTDGQNSLNFLGGLTWTSEDDWATLAFAISATEQGPTINQQIYSIVGTVQVTENLKYIIQHDYGQTYDVATAQKAEWYGINQYLLYDINQHWAAGMRFEWFRDDDGTRVTGLGDGNLNKGPVNGYYVGDFYEITAGLNWKPHTNLVVRPEVRWDWFDSGDFPSNGPYDAGDRKGQFLFGCDLILTY